MTIKDVREPSIKNRLDKAMSLLAFYGFMEDHDFYMSDVFSYGIETFSNKVDNGFTFYGVCKRYTSCSYTSLKALHEKQDWNEEDRKKLRLMDAFAEARNAKAEWWVGMEEYVYPQQSELEIEDLYDDDDEPFLSREMKDVFRNAYETLTMCSLKDIRKKIAARKIQRAVSEWLWQPRYSNGHIGFWARKGLEECGIVVPDGTPDEGSDVQ